jgi:hypothetical protein
MKFSILRSLFGCVVAVAVCLSGCAGQFVEQATNAARQDAVRNRLKELGMAFHNFHDTENRAATSWEELQRAGLSTQARQEIEAAGYTLVLGVGFREATVGSSNFLIAYPANATGEWILVAKMDGSVQQLPESEFRQALADQQQNMAQAVVVQPSAGGGAAGPPNQASAPSGGSSGPRPPPPPPPPAR